jgi:hypothetical protein
MMALPNADLLTLIAEISAAFVGFSLVVGLLQPDGTNATPKIQAMRAVAELALLSGAGAILVLLLNAYGLVELWVWKLGSGITAIAWAALHFRAAHRLKKFGSPWHELATFKVAGSIASVMIVLFAVNSMFPSAHSGPLHITGLCGALAVSALLFVLATFDPQTK